MEKVYRFKDLDKGITLEDLRECVYFTAPTAEDFDGKDIIEITVIPEKLKIRFFNPRYSLKNTDGKSPIVDYCEKHDIEVYVARLFNDIDEEDRYSDYSFTFFPKGMSRFFISEISCALGTSAEGNDLFMLDNWLTYVGEHEFELIGPKCYYGDRGFEFDSVTIEADCDEETGQFVFPDDSFAAKIILALEILRTNKESAKEKFPNISFDDLILASFY